VTKSRTEKRPHFWEDTPKTAKIENGIARHKRLAAAWKTAFPQGKYCSMIEVNGMEVPQSLDDLLDPRRVALIVYDMQVGITRQIGDRERVLQRVRHALDGA
jgi:hypothetical protein